MAAFRQSAASVARREINPRHPLLVTMRLDRTLGSYRSLPVYRAVERSLGAASDRFGVRIVHFSAQDPACTGRA